MGPVFVIILTAHTRGSEVSTTVILLAKSLEILLEICFFWFLWFFYVFVLFLGLSLESQKQPKPRLPVYSL